MKKNRISTIFPAIAFAFICVRLTQTQFQIASGEYYSLIISIIVPFFLFYIVETVRYFRCGKEERKENFINFCGSVALLILGTYLLFSIPYASYPAIKIY